jgi:hypothetical protein
MEAQHLSNTTTKQVIDSTRAFRVLVGVRRKLQKLGGSMYWKKSGHYVYLAQRSYHDIHKVVHLGLRSAETERLFEQFEAERTELQQREKVLSARIAIYERMNKAVRAGIASTQVIEAINFLEGLGISDDCRWLGTPALHAYWQSTGYEAPQALKERKEIGYFLVFVMRKLEAQTILKLKRCKALAYCAVISAHSSVLIIKSAKESRYAEEQAQALQHAHDALVAYLQQTAKEFLDELSEELSHAPVFEQVVISKTGKMGLMKTVGPQFLEAFNTLLGIDTIDHGALRDLCNLISPQRLGMQCKPGSNRQG